MLQGFLERYYYLIIGAVMFLLVCLELKQKLQLNKLIAAHKEKTGEEVSSTEIPAYRTVGMVVVGLLCLALSAVAYLKKPAFLKDADSYALMGVILAVIFISSVITQDVTQRLFYTPTGFFTKERFITFSSLSKVERTGRGVSILLGDGSQYTISPRQAIELDNLRSKRK